LLTFGDRTEGVLVVEWRTYAFLEVDLETFEDLEGHLGKNGDFDVVEDEEEQFGKSNLLLGSHPLAAATFQLLQQEQCTFYEEKVLPSLETHTVTAYLLLQQVHHCPRLVLPYQCTLYQEGGEVGDVLALAGKVTEGDEVECQFQVYIGVFAL
jgi:hypothetical protein